MQTSMLSVPTEGSKAKAQEGARTTAFRKTMSAHLRQHGSQEAAAREMIREDGVTHHFVPRRLLYYLCLRITQKAQPETWPFEMQRNLLDQGAGKIKAVTRWVGLGAGWGEGLGKEGSASHR